MAATLVAAPAAQAATPVQLLLPQGSAFAILGHSCGGIQEQAFATGFDANSGYPVGDVYMQTRCGGSGRGGGYHITTYKAWAAVTWDFAGRVVSFAQTTSVITNPSFSAYDTHGDEVYNASNQAWLVVVPPSAPTGVAAARSGGQYLVSWTPDPTAGRVITSSTITATPTSSTASIRTATVSGSATSGLLGPLAPQTTYSVTVVSNSAGGSSPPGGAVTITTPSSALPPGAPTAVKAHWTAPGSPNDALAASWSSGTAGDSPTDSYQITISGSDGGTYTQTVSGSTLNTTFTVSDVPDWAVKARAHDAAGWGPWSASVVLGGN